MKKRFDSPHPRQIPTTMKTIRFEIFELGINAIHSLLKCFIHEPNGYRQKNRIISTALLFERISCLVYRRRDGSFVKPPVSKYIDEIFAGFAETPEEVYDRVKSYGVTFEQAEHIFRLVWQVADIVCPMMACVCEQAFVSEYAYAIEYVIRHNGKLPKPEITLLFPGNYPDYNYSEGIAEEIREYEFP